MVPRPRTSTEACCPALPNTGCRSIVRRANGPSVAVIDAEALAGAPLLRPHQQGNSTRPGDAPRRSPGPDGLAGFVPPSESTAHRSGPAIGTSGRPLEPVRTGIKLDAERLARRTLHTVVSGHGLRLSTPRPLALRSAPDRRPGPACRGSPRHTLRAHAPHVAGTSRGYSTAARALVGKSFAPSAPRAGQGTPDAEAAEGLRLAVDVGRGARGQRPARS